VSWAVISSECLFTLRLAENEHASNIDLHLCRAPDQARRYQAWFDNARRVRDLLSELEARSLRAFEDAEE
jgi:hypothetical protein